MSLEITAAVLLAAALHAGWNALIKISGDRVAVMAVVTLAGSLLSLPFLAFVEAPDPASWPLLALTILLHTAYHIFLPIAYDHGDLGQVYPMARGSAPLLVTVGAVVLAGEVLEPLALVAVICLAVGVMTLTFDKATGIVRKPKAVVFALATGVCIASYTLVDGLGARQAGSVLGYAVWLTIGGGLLTFLIAVTWKRDEVWRVARANLVTGLAGGAMQIGAYWIIVWALALAPMGMVSALRETSVLFAAVISTFVLKEGFGVWRFVSAVLVSFGLLLGRSQK
ncbi:MAG: EamA family transporter [Gammaproteobacteria bacterium]|nr:EamA family transporter [Gammaproteobacteria bacterium]